MASKYMSTGSATYTAATLTISGATMSAVFASTDVGHTVVFRVSTTLYWGRIKTFVSTTSVVLHVATTLPSGNGTIAEMFVLDQGEAHTWDNYITMIKTLIQDDIGKLTDDELSRLLKSAVADWGADVEQVVTFKIAGDGTQSYSLATMLGAYWKPGEVVIKRLEYPTGTNPPTMLTTEDYYVYDDGTTQDGSNLKLSFVSSTPLATEYFALTTRIVPVLDEVAGQNYPDTEVAFSNITMLAAAYACLALASSYALSTDSTIMGDAVNYGDKMDKYLRLGREFLKRYNQSIFGSEEPTSSVAAATVTMELERRASDTGRLLFH